MLPQQPAGTIRLGRLFGIDVYLHWLWFLLLGIEITNQRGSATGGLNYHHMLWNLVEFLSIFGIVLMHEFGHALACKSVGGRADRIILWFLGGVAFVQPPPRPGAVLWSIAAGPLVNVVLVPVTVLAVMSVERWGAWLGPDFEHYVHSIAFINIAILIFNMLPIYPLDGGQIVQSLLWFVLGRARSLRIVATVGLVVGVLAAVTALAYRQGFLVLIGAFIAWQSFNGYRAARYLAMVEEHERGRF